MQCIITSNIPLYFIYPMKFMQNEQSSIPLFHSMFSLRIRLKSHIRNPRRACYWNGTFHIRENQGTHNISTDTWNHFGLSGLCCAANTSTNPNWDLGRALSLHSCNLQCCFPRLLTVSAHRSLRCCCWDNCWQGYQWACSWHPMELQAWHACLSGGTI